MENKIGAYLMFRANEQITPEAIKGKLEKNASSGNEYTTTSNFFQLRKKAYNTLPIFKAVCKKIASLSFLNIDEVATSAGFINSEIYKNLGVGKDYDKNFTNLVEELCKDYVIYGTCVLAVEYNAPINQIKKAVRIVRIDPSEHERVYEIEQFSPIKRIKEIKVNTGKESYTYPTYVKQKYDRYGSIKSEVCSPNDTSGFLRWDFYILDGADLSGSYTNYDDQSNVFDTLSRVTRIYTQLMDRTENDATNGFVADTIIPVDSETIASLFGTESLVPAGSNAPKKNLWDKFLENFKLTKQNQKNGEKVMFVPARVSADGSTIQNPNITVLDKKAFDQTIGATMQEMDLKLLQELGIEDPQIVGIKTAGSLGSSDLAEAKKSFYSEKVLPVSMAIENFLNKKILPLCNENWQVKFKVSEYVDNQSTAQEMQVNN